MTIWAGEKHMTVQMGITLGISITTFLLGIMYKLIDLSVKYGRLTRTLEANEERDAEERRKNAAKFTELYNGRNSHETAIARLDTTMRNIDAKLEKVDAKLDRNEQSVTRLEALIHGLADSMRKMESRLDMGGR